jgi:tetratricopeptide (TPR) repeat protein
LSKYMKVAVACALAVAMFTVGALLLSPDNGSTSGDANAPGTATALIAAPVVGEGKLDEVIANLQERLDGEAEDDWIGYATLGAAYLKKAGANGNPEFFPLAERALRRSIEIHGENPVAVPAMGELANARHEFTVARAWATRALELNPVSPVAHGILGDALVELGNYDAAFRTYQRMVDLRPGLPSYARVSYARELTGDVAGAKDAMRSALRSAGSDRYARAWAANELAGLHLRSGEPEAAAVLYEQALTDVPSFEPALVGLARADLARGRTAPAARRLEKVVERQPTPVHAALLGDLYTFLGRSAEADALYDLVVAQERLAEANGVQPDVEIPVFLADHEIRLKRALRIAEDLFSARKSIYVADAYAWTLHALGRDEEAWRLARRALSLGTRDASLHHHAGAIAYSLGRDADAIRHLSTALEIDPAFSLLHAPEARRMLKELRGTS